MPAPSLNFTKRRSAPVGKLFLLSFASIVLLALDQRFEGVQQIRKVAASLTFPLQWLASQPVELYRYTRSLAQSQTALQAQNRQLNAENIRLQATANQNRALEKELKELKSVLNLKQEDFGNSIAAEVVSSGRNFSSNLLVIDKGEESGVRQGDAVIDQRGLVGQIIQVRHLSADVRLISANDLIVPVSVARTGVRSLIYGEGGGIALRYFPQGADLQKEDILLTSGMDSIYPAGIPVAKVTEVSKNTGTAYYRSKLEPVAGLNISKYLLVIQQKTPAAGAASDPAASARP